MTAWISRNLFRSSVAGACLLGLAACDDGQSFKASAVHTDALATPMAQKWSPSEAPSPPDATVSAATRTLIAQARAPTVPPEAPASSPRGDPASRPALPSAPTGAGKPSVPARPVSDAELASRVKSAVLAEPLSALMFDVKVANGVVTLSGTADTPETRDKAVRAASAVEGVKSVNNRISLLSGS